MRKMVVFIAFLSFISVTSGVLDKCAAEEGSVSGRLLSEQEIATEKFLSGLESALAKKFFHYRNRPIVRVAIFEFTDGSGNVVKGGRELAANISWRLCRQIQFDVVSQERINRYLRWNGVSALGKLDAQGLRRLQRRINTMDPENGIHALLTGEVRKGVGRSLHVTVSLTNFQFKIGEIELEKNIVDAQSFSTEIPIPTEQALQEAGEIVLRGESRPLEEGRLLILANTRGSALLETDYGKQFSKEQPFPWAKVPHVFTLGLDLGPERVTIPTQVKIGLEELPLPPLGAGGDSGRYLEYEYAFLHGKCATNEIYFDGLVSAENYQLITSFKANEIYAESSELKVYSGTTTIVVISIFVPNERERILNKQSPRINVFQLFGKGTKIFPGGR